MHWDGMRVCVDSCADVASFSSADVIGAAEVGKADQHCHLLLTAVTYVTQVTYFRSADHVILQALYI
jgi:hypothetical protein